MASKVAKKKLSKVAPQELKVFKAKENSGSDKENTEDEPPQRANNTQIETAETELNSAKISRPSSANSGKLSRVVPLNDDVTAEMNSQGSVLSCRSAWTAENDGSQVLVRSSKPSLQDSKTGAGENRAAYVPYIFARNCIARIEDDMQLMKKNHVRIVGDIQTVYQEIEEDSKQKVTEFAKEIRTRFGDRLGSYKITIEALRQELLKVKKEEEEVRASCEAAIAVMLEEKNQLLKEKEMRDIEVVEMATETDVLEEKSVTPFSAPIITPQLHKEQRPATDEKLLKELEIWKAKCQDLDGNQKELAEWKVKYEVLRDELTSMNELRGRYAALQTKMATLTVLAATVDKEKAAEQKEKCKKEKVMMEEEKQNLDKELKRWSNNFEKENGRPPTEEDRGEGQNELILQQVEVNSMLNNLDSEMETLDALEHGKLPESPPLQALPVVRAEPIVKTVEVEVVKRDEVMELRLQEALAEVERLKEAAAAAATVARDAQEPSFQETTQLQSELDTLEAELRDERAAHLLTKDELEALRAQNMQLMQLTSSGKEEAEAVRLTALETELESARQEAENARKHAEKLSSAKAEELPGILKKELEDAQLEARQSKVAVQTAKSASVNQEALVAELTAKVRGLEKAQSMHKKVLAQMEKKIKEMRDEKASEAKKLSADFEKKETKRVAQEQARVEALERRIKVLQASSGAGAGAGQAMSAGGGVGGLDPQTAKLQEQVKNLQEEKKDLKNQLKMVGKVEQKSEQKGGLSEMEKKKMEKVLKELEKKLDAEKAKLGKTEEKLNTALLNDAETSKDLNLKEKEIVKLKAEVAQFGDAAKDAAQLAEQLKEAKKELKKVELEVTELTENYNSERILRKKYYNMVEDMKGKIRVFARARPLSKSELTRGNYSVLRSPDEYSINVSSTRGLKEFQFDQIFMPEHGQDKVFEDTYNLVQSAVDGYNVCIFAYGQTGSGKTYTMIGAGGTSADAASAGIAPRAFRRIFELIEENQSKFSFQVSIYMLELYNDKLLDLFDNGGAHHDDKLDIKKDKKGMVYIPGAEVKMAADARQLEELFDSGSKNRHTASTSMNAESSRSHLVLGIIIESTNKVTGQVTKGKLSLVDLAGSERVAKTNASAEQLREANSINKSLSALGDVISALSSDQQFIPYRNNKLTMLMQDSLGGNSKTLMFVNISPADYNTDETIISLTYASRVKLITNDAQKNSDNKEISRLKHIIAKLKKGEHVDDIDD